MNDKNLPEWAKPTCPQCGSWKGIWHNEHCPVRIAEESKARALLAEREGIAVINAGQGYGESTTIKIKK